MEISMMLKIKYIIYILLAFVPWANLQESFKFISTNADSENEKYNIKMIKNEDKKCENLETLNLEQMNLRFIKENIIQCNGVRHINLQNNFFEEIPNLMLRNVPYLHCLNLSNNHINLHNSHALQHQYLQVLDVSYQNVPNEYENMVDIELDEPEEENIYAENIYKSQQFNNSGIFLPNLKYLDLSGNHMSAIAHDFNISFPQLTNLFLININAFTIDEQFFNKIPNSLRFLHLENNHLKNLELKNLANITALYLDGNPLEKIDIISTKLKLLSLSNCILDTATFNTPSLEYLDLSKNNLYSISNIYFENQLLQTLLLDNNKFVEVPTLTNSQLSKLSLSYNMIKEISPNRFINLIYLQKLSLKGNGIEIIEKNAFSGLTKLEYLDLSENNLKNLPYDWHLSLINLRNLNVNSNNLTTIFDLPIRYISSLQHLSVKNNFFTKISTRELDALPNMTTIYLA